MGADQETTKVSYALRNNGGGTIVLPGWCLDDLANLAIPEDLYAGDTTQKYPLGTKLYKDNRVFAYCKAGATITTGHVAFLKVNANYDPGVTGHTNVDGFEGALLTGSPVVVGDTHIHIADTTARAKNYYEGADLVLQYDAGGVMDQYRIIASDVGDGSTSVVVYIAPPGIIHACPVSGTAVDAYMNKYSNIQSGLTLDCIHCTAMGAFGAAMTSGKFYWLQVGGPVTLTGTGGTTSNHRMVYANTDGSVVDTVPVAAAQEVGYVTGRTVSGYGSLLITLTLDN